MTMARLLPVVLCVLACGTGCVSGGPGEVTSMTRQEAASVDLSVRSISLWDDIKGRLKTDFELNEADALELANAVQGTSVIQNANEILANLGFTLPSIATTTTQDRVVDNVDPAKTTDTTTTNRMSASGATDTTASAPQTQKIETTLAPKGPVSSDPFRSVQTARDLIQWYALLNHDIDSVAMDQKYVAYLVRLQVTVTPNKRLQPYDIGLEIVASPAEKNGAVSPMIAYQQAAADLKFNKTEYDTVTNSAKGAALKLLGDQLGIPKNARDSLENLYQADPGRPEATDELGFASRYAEGRQYCSDANRRNRSRPLRIVPLVVTDQLESMEEQAADLAAARVGIAAQGGFNFLGLNIGGGSSSQSLQEALTRRSNSLYSLSRLNDSTLQMRFGAKFLGKNYEMQALNHIVTLVALVPRDWVSSSTSDGLCVLNFSGRASVTNVHTGVQLPAAEPVSISSSLGGGYDRFLLESPAGDGEGRHRSEILKGLAFDGDADSFDLVALKPFCEVGLTMQGNSPDSPLQKHVAWGNVVHCSQVGVARVDPTLRALSRALYLDFVRLQAGDLVVASGPLRAWRKPEWPVSQTVIAVNGNSGITASIVGGYGLDTSKIGAVLEGVSFSESGAPVVLPATRIGFDSKSLTLGFPALSALGEAGDLKLAKPLTITLSVDARDQAGEVESESCPGPLVNKTTCDRLYSVVLTNPSKIRPFAVESKVDSTELVAKDGVAGTTVFLTFAANAPDVLITADGAFAIDAITDAAGNALAYDASEFGWIARRAPANKPVQLKLVFKNAKAGGEGKLTFAPVGDGAEFQSRVVAIKIAG